MQYSVVFFMLAPPVRASHLISLKHLKADDSADSTVPAGRLLTPDRCCKKTPLQASLDIVQRPVQTSVTLNQRLELAGPIIPTPLNKLAGHGPQRSLRAGSH